MNETTIKNILEASLKALFENQPDIFKFTPTTGPTEWNLAHHFANEIYKHFSEYQHDLDVIKRPYDNKRPDIIFHKRGTHKRNFLVLEVKRDGSPAELEDDIRKIKDFWFKGPLHYQFGAVVNIKEDKTGEVKVVKNE